MNGYYRVRAVSAQMGRPNVQGNRRAAPMVIEDQGTYRRVRLTVRLANDLVVLGMSTDPEPGDPVLNSDPERTVVQANPDRIILTDPLQVKRRMARIRFEKCERFVRKRLDFGRQGAIASPEIRRSIVDQSFDDFPAACSLRARSAKEFSFPALASDSN